MAQAEEATEQLQAAEQVEQPEAPEPVAQEEQAEVAEGPPSTKFSSSLLIVVSKLAEDELIASAETLARLLRLDYALADPMEFAMASDIRPPWPKVVITVGEETGFIVPLLRRVSAYTFFISLGNPNRSLKDFDLVLAPDHDLPKGHMRYGHVIRYKLGLSRLLPQDIERFRQSGSARKLRLGLPVPRLTAIFGAGNALYELDAGVAAKLIARLKRTVDANRGSLMVATSPNTAPEAVEVLRHQTQGEKYRFRACEKAEDYQDFLGAATHLATTWESAGRLANFCALRQALYLLPLPKKFVSGLLGSEGDLGEAHQMLCKEKYARIFEEDLSVFMPPPLEEMARVSALVRDRVEPRIAGTAHTA